MKKIFFLVYLFFLGFLLTAFSARAQFGIMIQTLPSSPEAGQSATITITGTGPSTGNPYVWVDIDFGDTYNSNIDDFTNSDGTFAFSFPHVYLNPGDYIITTKVCVEENIGAPKICETIKTSITVIVPPAPTCVPDGCNGNCPSNCDVSQDPDCGCQDGDGCCGIGCDNSNDSDCPAVPGVDKYRNPLVWGDIPAFIWGAIMYLFGYAIVLLVLFILIGAYVLATSGGSTQRIKLGKNIIIWAIIGYVVMLLARGIINFIWDFIKS